MTATAPAPAPPGAPPEGQHHPPGADLPRPAVAGLPIPAHGSVTLSPLSDDAVLIEPAPYESDMTVPLTLIIRHAGRVQVEATVSAPGSR